MIKNKYSLFLLIIIFIIIIGFGCGSSNSSKPTIQEHPVDIEDPTTSIVFGYIDTTRIYSRLAMVKFRKLKPPSAFDYFGYVASRDSDNRGLFFNLALPNGHYEVQVVVAASYDGRWLKPIILQRKGNPSFKKIKKPGVYYLGSYKVMQVDIKQYALLTIDPNKNREASEKKLLKKLLGILETAKENAIARGKISSERLEAIYARAIKMINKRIKKLSTI